MGSALRRRQRCVRRWPPSSPSATASGSSSVTDTRPREKYLASLRSEADNCPTNRRSTMVRCHAEAANDRATLRPSLLTPSAQLFQGRYCVNMRGRGRDWADRPAGSHQRAIRRREQGMRGDLRTDGEQIGDTSTLAMAGMVLSPCARRDTPQVALRAVERALDTTYRRHSSGRQPGQIAVLYPRPQVNFRVRRA